MAEPVLKRNRKISVRTMQALTKKEPDKPRLLSTLLSVVVCAAISAMFWYAAMGGAP